MAIRISKKAQSLRQPVERKRRGAGRVLCSKYLDAPMKQSLCADCEFYCAGAPELTVTYRGEVYSRDAPKSCHDPIVRVEA